MQGTARFPLLGASHAPPLSQNSFGGDEEPYESPADDEARLASLQKKTLFDLQKKTLFDLQKKTLFDRIQADFPRTPSPVYGLGLKAPAHGKALPSPKKVNPPPWRSTLNSLCLHHTPPWCLPLARRIACLGCLASHRMPRPRTPVSPRSSLMGLYPCCCPPPVHDASNPAMTQAMQLLVCLSAAPPDRARLC